MLTKCENCEFHIHETDEFCLNCGINHPTKDIHLPKSSQVILSTLKLLSFKIFFALLLTLIILFLITEGDFSILVSLQDYILLTSLTIGFILSFVSVPLVKIWYKTNMVSQRLKNRNNLTSIKRIIDKRLSDLSNRSYQIDIVLDRIKNTDSEQLQETRKKLLSAREIVTGQYARYELQAKKIEIARVQNNVLPFLKNLHRLTEFETENGLITIENTKDKVEKIRQNLTNFYAIEFPKAIQSERDNFLGQLTETEDSCDKLREALLSKQAARALRGISPIEENINAPSSKEIAHAVETFNIQSTLTDFSESFEELENEYLRLRAENDVGKKLSTEREL